MKRNDFNQELKSVLREIEGEREQLEEQAYQKFLSSGGAEKYVPSEEFCQKILTLTVEQEEKSQMAISKGMYLPKKVVAVLLILLCSLSVTVVLQASGYNLLEVFRTPTHTEVKISNNFRKKYVESITAEKVYFPEYIPKDYALDGIQSKNLYVKTTFRKGQDEITITQMAQPQDITTFMDSENASIDEQVQVGGAAGYYIYKDGVSSLVLYKDIYSILIIAPLDKKETIKIANIRWCLSIR